MHVTLGAMGGELNAVDLARRALDDYADAAGEQALERVRAAAAPVEGARVLHLAAAGAAGRPAELLGSLLPLMRGLGVEIEWRVLTGGTGFSKVVRQLEAGLLGAETALGADDWEEYRETWEDVDTDGYDAVVAHDPAGLGAALASGSAKRLWRLHLDASQPDAPVWQHAEPLAQAFDATGVALASFAPPGIDRAAQVEPGIDPLAPRNRELPVKLAGDALRFLGIDLTRPFVCQVGALDPWRDPHETIDAFRLVREELPGLQLVLAGAPPREGSDGWGVVGEVADYAADIPDLLVLTGYVGVGEQELNAMQRLARAAVVTAIREDFALTAAEALWKGTPVVAPPAGGIPEQVTDGEHGFLAAGAEAIARRVVDLVRDPALGIVLGAAGRERVRERFLVTRLLEDELRLLHATLAA